MLSAGSVVAEGRGSEVLDPTLIRAHFGAEVRIFDDGFGGTVVVPVRSQDDINASNPRPTK